LTTLEERKTWIGLISEATTAGARQAPACEMLGLSARTVQRWQGGEPDAVDGRSLRHYEPSHKLSADERAQLLAVANSAEFGHLPPSQIVWLTSNAISLQNRPSTGYCGKRNSSHTGAVNDRPTRAASHARSVPTRRISCTAGISLTCQRRFVGSISICICLWTCSAA
jgi:putative transposase